MLIYADFGLIWGVDFGSFSVLLSMYVSDYFFPLWEVILIDFGAHFDDFSEIGGADENAKRFFEN